LRISKKKGKGRRRRNEGVEGNVRGALIFAKEIRGKGGNQRKHTKDLERRPIEF